jgi:hypothetical protein
MLQPCQACTSVDPAEVDAYVQGSVCSNAYLQLQLHPTWTASCSPSAHAHSCCEGAMPHHQPAVLRVPATLTTAVVKKAYHSSSLRNQVVISSSANSTPPTGLTTNTTHRCVRKGSRQLCWLAAGSTGLAGSRVAAVVSPPPTLAS